jgi:hypothetical protein
MVKIEKIDCLIQTYCLNCTILRIKKENVNQTMKKKLSQLKK